MKKLLDYIGSHRPAFTATIETDGMKINASDTTAKASAVQLDLIASTGTS
ncbi:MAG TPA: hypothetical protein VJI70_04115 [Candidatus Paceibacterota bacterium]